MTDLAGVQDFARKISSGLHEVKQPLAALQITLELALLPGQSSESQRKHMETALTLFERLSGSVGLLSELVALYKVPLPVSRCCLDELLPAALESVGLCFRDRNLAVRTVPASEPLYVQADKPTMERFLSMLFRYVAESAPTGSAIDIRCGAGEDGAVLSIVDTTAVADCKGPSGPGPRKLSHLLLFSLAEVLGTELQEQMDPFKIRIAFA